MTRTQRDSDRMTRLNPFSGMRRGYVPNEDLEGDAQPTVFASNDEEDEEEDEED